MSPQQAIRIWTAIMSASSPSASWSWVLCGVGLGRHQRRGEDQLNRDPSIVQ